MSVFHGDREGLNHIAPPAAMHPDPIEDFGVLLADQRPARPGEERVLQFCEAVPALDFVWFETPEQPGPDDSDSVLCHRHDSSGAAIQRRYVEVRTQERNAGLLIGQQHGPKWGPDTFEQVHATRLRRRCQLADIGMSHGV